jgi:integrase
MASLYKRGKVYWLKYYVGGKRKETSLRTDSYQIAREKQRRFESNQARGIDNPLPTRTPIAQVVQKYVEHIRTTKTAKSAQTDVYYLREAFGAVCPALEVTSRTVSEKTRKRPLKDGVDRRCRQQIIEASCFEAITTEQIADLIGSLVRARGLAPRTANRYREIICRLFNWSMAQGGIRLPADKNPAAPVERYKERAPEIRYLTVPQIDEQLHALRFKPQLQTMTASLIYAGLRREELLWLTVDDVKISTRDGGLIQVRAKTIHGESWQPKTKVNRAVPISRTLREYLAKYTPRPSDAGWFFPSPDGTRWDPDNFSADLRQANADTGLRWACLDYRHTFGSQLAQKGVSLYQISALMGNSPEICRRHYAALVPEAMEAEIEFPASSKQLQTG